jgi:hypothetical protein
VWKRIQIDGRWENNKWDRRPSACVSGRVERRVRFWLPGPAGCISEALPVAERQLEIVVPRNLASASRLVVHKQSTMERLLLRRKEEIRSDVCKLRQI